MSFCAFTSALCSTRNWQISRLPFSAANISGVSSLDDKEKMNETKLKKKKPEVLAEVWEFVIPFGFRIDIGFVLNKKFTNTEMPFSRRNVQRSESPGQIRGYKR